jgi:DNA-binding NtrC family response regulator
MKNVIKKPSTARVLVVEDEAYVRDSLVELLQAREYEVVGVGGVAEALKQLERSPVDVVLTDLKMPGLTGLDLVTRLQASSPGIPVIVLTGHGNVAAAVECLQAGATDFILKPADPQALAVSISRALGTRALKREVAYLRDIAQQGDDRPLGQSAAWKKVVANIEAAAPTGATVLLRGESGTGKELLARLIHRLSPRANGPYIRVNCAAVPIDIWESEFFGHRKGAFTGAASDREGRFHLADGGTLFLDEIGAMPLAAQAKLLRAIQDGEFDRIGDVQPTRVDVRFVAATNSDLEAEIKRGQFRQDLYYRLAVLEIHVPALRERPDDIPLLATRFAAEVARRLGRPAADIGPETAARFMTYSWPGNVRELQNVIERALILNPEGGLDQLDLAPEAGMAPSSFAAESQGDLNLRSVMNRYEKDLLVEAQRRSKGVRKEAARLLGIDPRNLNYYLRKHNLADDGE